MFFVNPMFVFGILFSMFFYSNLVLADDSDFIVSPKYATVFLNKDGDRYSVRWVSVVDSRFSSSRRLDGVLGAFNGRTVSFKGETQSYFSIATLPLVSCWDGFPVSGEPTGGCKVTEKGNFSVDVPLFPNTAEAILYTPDGKPFLTVDLRSVAECNEDAVCDYGETKEICPSDCRGGSVTPPDESGGKGSEGVTGPVINGDLSGGDVVKTFSPAWLLIAIGSFFLAIFVGIFLYLRYRKRKARERESFQNPTSI